VSRNQLFDHLREEGHDDRQTDGVRGSEEGHDDRQTDGVRGSLGPVPATPTHPVPPPSALVECLAPEFDEGLAAAPVPLPFAPKSKASLKVARTIEGLLTQDECTRLIELTTRRGYGQALVNVGGGMQRRMDDVRRSGRCIVDSHAFAEVLWRRVKPLCSSLDYHSTGGGWEPVGLNERFRFLRYSRGDYFRPHRDGSFVREPSHPHAGDRSYATLMLYLDTPTDGGETNFLNQRDDGTVGVTAVMPSAGLGLVFEHDLLHEGATLKDGVKHAIRTDIMFRLRPRC